MRKISIYAFTMLIVLSVSFLMAGASSAVSSKVSNRRMENSIQVKNNGAPVVEWNMTYGTTRTPEGEAYVGNSVIQTSDGGFAIVSSSDFGSGHEADTRIWLVKTDSLGNAEWNETYGGAAPNTAISLVQTSDGGYAIVGDTTIGGYGNAWLVKTDSNGNMQWNESYTELGWATAYALIQTNDGGYIISGDKDYHAWLMKTDANGTMLWSNSFAEVNNSQLQSVVQTSDGGYVAAGGTQYPPFSGKVDAYVVKTDSDGNITWSAEFSQTTGDDYGRSIVQTSDGGYAIAGETDHWGNADFWLIRIDASGNLLRDKTFGGAGWDGANTIVQTSDGGFVLAGMTNSFGAGGNDIWLVKTVASGNMQWNETFGGAGDDGTGAVGSSVVQTNDGGYALCGYTDSFSVDGSYQVWLIKLAPLSPRTITVPDDYPTIQGAINAANDGDTVFVRNGTYYENVVVNKTLSLVGEKRDSVVVDGSNSGYVVDITAQNVSISQFTLQNSGTSWSGVNVESSGTVILDNLMIDNHGGVWVRPSALNTTISGNDIFNKQPSYADGIRLWSSGTLVVGNTITNESTGIGCDAAGNTIEGNIVANNSIGVGGSPASLFFHNSLINNGQQATPVGSNIWDNGYPSGGNYWSNYNSTDIYCGVYQNKTESDGIGDTPYVIDASNKDNYPLMNPWSPPDIAVMSLTSSKTVIGQGYTGSVNVTFENLGSKIEDFNATVYANSTCIYPELTMLAMTNCTLCFEWNTTGFAYGNYTITASAEFDPSENSTPNNCTWSAIVTIPGDINGDFKVNMRDIAIIARCFGSTPSSSNWNPNADINGDSSVNMRDIALVARHFGQHL